MFRHLLNLIRPPRMSVVSVCVPSHDYRKQPEQRKFQDDPARAVTGRDAVKDHPTLPLCLASGVHLQIQVEFVCDPYSLEAHKGEDFGFL